MGIMISQILLFAYNFQGLGVLADTLAAMVVSISALFILGYSVYGLISNNREALGWAVLATCVLISMRAGGMIIVEGALTGESALSITTAIILFGIYLDRDDI